VSKHKVNAFTEQQEELEDEKQKQQQKATF